MVEEINKHLPEDIRIMGMSAFLCPRSVLPLVPAFDSGMLGSGRYENEACNHESGLWEGTGGSDQVEKAECDSLASEHAMRTVLVRE